MRGAGTFTSSNWARNAGRASANTERHARFAEELDATLCRLNDDYAAHRAGGYGMDAARVRVLSPGGFAAWMKSRGKLGGRTRCRASSTTGSFSPHCAALPMCTET